jgi:predicted MFS family arabinose efflux permease
MDFANKNISSELPQLNRRLIILIAVASGIAVANIYYIQPLLEQIAGSYHITQAGAGLLATLTQIGYALGLFLILPLADLVERKKLILTMIVLAALFLFTIYLSSNFVLTASACLAIGIASVIPQLMVPMGANLQSVLILQLYLLHIYVFLRLDFKYGD